MAKRLLTLTLAVVLGVAFVAPAMAEVQNIKVSGDMIMRGIYRDNLDFVKDSGDETEAWISTGVRVGVGVEFTDNVMAMVRVINERDWGKSVIQTAAGAGTVVGLPLDTSDDIKLDLAYAKINDLFIPGLNVTLGRQELLLGKGFVVGNVNSNLTAAANTAIRAWDLTSRKSFDAIKAEYELGIAPLSFTVMGAKIIEESNNAVTALIPIPAGDSDLWGLNVAYQMDNAVIEGYLLNLKRQAIPVLVTDKYDIWTLGARVDHDVAALPGFNYNLELGYQFGDGADVNGDGTSDDKKAWAGTADVSYTFNNPYSPKIGAAYTYYSGPDFSATVADDEGWDPIFPDGQAGRIGNVTNAVLSGTPAAFLAGIGNATNLSVPKIYASFKPGEKHALSLDWYIDTQSTEVPAGTGDKLGWEVDLGYAYQLNSDVTMGLSIGYMEADDDFVGTGAGVDDTAMEVIGSVSLAF
ncbi:MAG TPA: alginate export family protein [bacterium]|nr:alginate export family protein [bacterium]HNS48186.1 alginate export family protein [bacterium]